MSNQIIRTLDRNIQQRGTGCIWVKIRIDGQMINIKASSLEDAQYKRDAVREAYPEYGKPRKDSSATAKVTRVRKEKLVDRNIWHNLLNGSYVVRVSADGKCKQIGSVVNTLDMAKMIRDDKLLELGRIVIRHPKTQAERDEIARLNAQAGKARVDKRKLNGNNYPKNRKKPNEKTVLPVAVIEVDEPIQPIIAVEPVAIAAIPETISVIETPKAWKPGAFFINEKWIARTADGNEYPATSAEDAQGTVKRGKPFVCP